MGPNDVWLDLLLVSFCNNGSSFLQQCFCFVLSYGVCVCFRLWTYAVRRLCFFCSVSTDAFVRVQVFELLLTCFCTILCGWFNSLWCLFFQVVPLFGVFSLVCVFRCNRNDLCAGANTHFLPLRPCFHFFLQHCAVSFLPRETPCFLKTEFFRIFI